MAKKLADIAEKIKDSEKKFYGYLQSIVPAEAMDFLISSAQTTNVYLFSGIIRNYFIEANDIRDLDFVVEDVVLIEDLINKHKFKKNSFGGYKVLLDDINIDLWEVKNTWAFNYQREIDYQLYKVIPYTSFFNFSSILYHVNEKKFIFSKDFLRFLRDKRIEISYEPNPNYELCLINTVYYSIKYKLKVGPKLKFFLKEYYHDLDTNYPEIQKKHFGDILFSTEELNKKIRLVLHTNKAFESD